jgi:hypothetical protein
MSASSGSSALLQPTISASRIIYSVARTSRVTVATARTTAAQAPEQHVAVVEEVHTIYVQPTTVFMSHTPDVVIGTTAGGGNGGGIPSEIGTFLHAAGGITASAAGGCASSAGAFATGALVATGGTVSALGPGFLGAVGFSCLFGSLSGAIGYSIGPDSDTPNSMMSDFRDGMEYGFHR